MALTQQVKSELATVVTTKPCCRRAETAAMLRFGGGLHGIAAIDHQDRGFFRDDGDAGGT